MARYRVESAAIVFVVIGCIHILIARDASSRRSTHSAPIPLALLAVSIALAACLYAPAATIGLLSDDFVLSRAAMSSTLGVGSNWFFRPLPLLLWRIIATVTESPIALHGLNIVLHGLNAFLVAALGVGMGMRRDIALAGAALFLTFPAAPEAVAWASGVHDVLMTTTALGAAVIATGGYESVRAVAAIVAIFALGLAAKETAVCIPALVVVAAEPTRALHGRARRIALHALLAAVLAVYVAGRLHLGIRQGFLTTPSRYFFKQLIANTFASLVGPWRATFAAAHPLAAFSVVVIMTVLLTCAFVLWSRDEPAAQRAVRLTIWALLAVAPVFSYFYVNASLEGSRYLYLAECGWALLAAELVSVVADRLPAPRIVLATAIGCAVALSIVLVEQEVAVWRRAGRLRDAVLESADTVVRQSGCTTADFRAVPDSLDGAYVFRNGFADALQPPVRLGAAEPRCTFRWNGASFVPDAGL